MTEEGQGPGGSSTGGSQPWLPPTDPGSDPVIVSPRASEAGYGALGAEGAGRISPGISASALSLGPLAGLPGAWTGTGFSQIWRPMHGTNDHFLQLNMTREHLAFNPIGGLVPNRGLAQPDIALTGVRYLQQISDGSDLPPPSGGGALHIEPGIWLLVPATVAPKAPASVVRIGSVTNGVSVFAQGSTHEIDGPPHISPVDITPFVVGHPDQLIPFPNETNIKHHSNLRNHLAHAITQRMVDNPNVLLSDRLAHQHVMHTTVLHVDSEGIDNGGLRSIPFLRANAAANRLHATFRIETVRHPDGGTFLQLQYTQRVLLDFNGLSWPHVSVANLVLTGA